MAWIASAAGIGLGALGQERQAESTIEGARTKADIEEMNRLYQRKLFDEAISDQEPYYQAGKSALPLLEQYRTQGGIDLSNNPLVNMQRSAGMEGLQMAGQTRPETSNYFSKMLNATNQTPAYNRLLDLQKIGLGSASTAGNYLSNQGNALASSYMAGGNALAQGVGSAGNQRQSLYSNVAGQVGQIPAYYDYLRRTQ